MRAAFLRENIVAEAEYIFLKCIDKLERHFNLDLVADALKINRIMNRRLRAVQLAHIRHDAVRLRISHFFSLARPLIFIKNRQLRVQIRRLMQAALEPIRFKTCFLKNLRIRQELDLRSGLSCLTNHRQKTIDQLNRRDAALIRIVMDLSILIYIDLQMRREGIDNRRTDTVQTAARLVRIVVKLAARVQGREHDSLRCHALFMHLHRNTASIVPDGAGSVRLQRHADLGTGARQVLIDRVVHDLIDQVIQSLRSHTSYIHTRTLTDSLQPLQNRYAVRIILC